MGARSKVIVINAGHGGIDPGAIGINGIREKDINLTVVLELEKALKARGFTVILTRNDDTYQELFDIGKMAVTYKADFFLSVHHNAGGGDRAEVIHKLVKGLDDIFATNVANEFKKIGQPITKAYTRESDISPGKEYYGVLRASGNVTGAIVEFAFVDSPKGYELINTEDKLKLEAAAIAKALCSTFNVKYDLPKAEPVKRALPIIKQGSTGDAVKVVQKTLKIDVDGVFGPNTDRAVRNFQKKKGIPVDGVVGVKTYNSLGIK